MAVLVYYDPRTVVDVPTGRWCWRCLHPCLVERTITAHLLIDDDGVSTQRIRWIECPTCGKQSRATGEAP